MGVATPNDWPAFRKFILWGLIIFALLMHLLRAFASHTFVPSGELGSWFPGMGATAIHAFDDARRKAGSALYGSAKHCPASVLTYCEKGTSGLRLILGLH